jgi:LacI family transcriptional regulator
MGSMPDPGPVRLRDVAIAAGVSRSTASRVLSGSGASDAAVAAVLAATKQLGYRPDPVARAMRTRSTSIAGIVVPAIGNPFFAELIEALEKALRFYKLDVILGDSGGSVADEADRIGTMVDRKIDGLIVIPTHHHASIPALRAAARSVPVVQVDRHIDTPLGDYVGLDNAAGVHAALDHLIDEGCRRVVFVSGTGSTAGQARLQAFQAGVRRLPGLKAQRPLLGSFTLDFGRQAVELIMQQKQLLRALRLHKVEVPRQVKVTGFDGILFAELCDPPLTTLRQPVPVIAAEVARLLNARLHGDSSPPRRSEVAPLLIVRQSSSENAD